MKPRENGSSLSPRTLTIASPSTSTASPQVASQNGQTRWIVVMTRRCGSELAAVESQFRARRWGQRCTLGAMPRTSAGLLLFRSTPNGVEVLLVHPGGPLFARKDLGAWSIPKGEIEPGEELLAVAHRELAEETGFAAAGRRCRSGKCSSAAGRSCTRGPCAATPIPRALRSNTFEMEWPPKSGTAARVSRGRPRRVVRARRGAPEDQSGAGRVSRSAGRGARPLARTAARPAAARSRARCC